MKKSFISFLHICIIYSLILTTIIYSQNLYNLSQFKDETINFVKLPLSWNKNDILKLSIVAATTFLSMQIDQQIRDEILKDRSYYKSFPIEFGKKWGEIYTTVIIGGAFSLHGLIEKENSTKRIGFEIFQSAIYSGIITQFLKISTGRARPFTNKGSNYYEPFTFFNDDFHSFTSGHTTLAFSISTILSENSKSNFLKPIFFIPAILTAISRVYQDNHWTSDVFLGAATGYFVGKWIHKIHNQDYSANEYFEFGSIYNFQWVNLRLKL